jgi:3-O-methylgallate 3,4-dioxygenase
MSEIVLGVGTSHSPVLSTPPENWLDHAMRDPKYPLFEYNGENISFDQRIVNNKGKYKPYISQSAQQSFFDRTEACLALLRQEIRAVRPDVCVVIADDQEEMFDFDNMPAFGVYYGKEILCKRPDLSKKSEAIRLSAWGYYTDEPTVFPAHAELGLHLIRHTMDAGFDVSTFSSQPRNSGMSHAVTFLYRRILDATVPVVPVFINAFYPPNQPRMGRVIEFGHELRKAIKSFPSELRVAVIASGGLSHFLVNETLDRAVLHSLEQGDLEILNRIPESALKSGNSEIKNWAALGATMAPSKMELVDYVPVYRSEAGSGCGMAFGLWK